MGGGPSRHGEVGGSKKGPLVLKPTHTSVHDSRASQLRTLLVGWVNPFGTRPVWTPFICA